MAIMIPPFYENKITSDGEKKFFRNLQLLSDDYTVIHSLGIAEHREKVFGEIDFLIICSQGILCLEIKGGYVSRKDGVWYFTDRYGNENMKAEGPFRQVFTAMLSLRDHLKKVLKPGDPIINCQFACGVVFPDMPFTSVDPDVIQEIIFDTRSSFDELNYYIKNVFNYWKKQLEDKHSFSGKELSPYNIQRARNHIRGDFGFVPSLGYIVNKTGEKLLALTQEQIDRLAMASENERILLKGGAGTGKTLLSLEYARRNARDGKRVLYLCFNKNLAHYLEFGVEKGDEDLKDFLTIEYFHSYISTILYKRHILPEKGSTPDSEFYSSVLPECFQVAAENGQIDELYDVLVIDEGQDLLRYEYIMCFDVLLRGGLENGKWHICYDLNQNIYNEKELFEEALQMIKDYKPAIFALDTNCRNTRSIGVYNTVLTGVTPARHFKVDGERPNKYGFSNNEDECQQVVNLIKSLLKQGIGAGNICILSKYKFENSCMEGRNIFHGICSFQNITNLDPQHLIDSSIKFSTIHSFKGLEAPVVILLDVDEFQNLNSRLLNYTAISRASSLLFIFYKNDVETDLLDMVGSYSILLDEIID